MAQPTPVTIPTKELAGITKFIGQTLELVKPGAGFKMLQKPLQLSASIQKQMLSNSQAAAAFGNAFSSILGAMGDMLVLALWPLLRTMLPGMLGWLRKLIDIVTSVHGFFMGNGKSFIGAVADWLAGFLNWLADNLLRLAFIFGAFLGRLLMSPDFWAFMAKIIFALPAIIVLGLILGFTLALWDAVIWLKDNFLSFLTGFLEPVISVVVFIADLVRKIVELVMGVVDAVKDVAGKLGGAKKVGGDIMQGDLGGAAGRLFGKGDSWDWW